MKIRKSIAIAAAGAVAVVGLGTTGAVAGKMVGSQQIKKNAVTSKHIKKNAVKSGHIVDGTIKARDLKGNLKAKIQDGAKSDVQVEVAEMDAEVTTIKHIGGSINDNNTALDGTELSLPAGEYLVTVDGAFMKNEAAADTWGTDIFPQISLFVDKSGDGNFQWQEDEGDISPNTLMTEAADRHLFVSGTTVLNLDEETDVSLLAFGYAADQSSKASGDIDVIEARITASKIG